MSLALLGQGQLSHSVDHLAFPAFDSSWGEPPTHTSSLKSIGPVGLPSHTAVDTGICWVSGCSPKGLQKTHKKGLYPETQMAAL